MSSSRAKGLTAVIGREPVFSTWYGRWPEKWAEIGHLCDELCCAWL